MSIMKIGNTRASIIPKMASIMLVLLLMSTLPFIVKGNEDLEPVHRTSGSTNNAKLGWNVTALKDIDGDGITDYAIAAPGENRVYIFNGPWSSLMSLSSPNWRITGPASSNFGWDVNTIDDYTGDGKNEVIIGSPGESKAYVFIGRSKGTYTTLTQLNAAISIIGVSGELLGHSVAGIDYENNDNIFAIVGAPRQLHTINELGGDYRTGAVYKINLSLALSEERTSITPETDKAYTSPDGARLVFSIYGYDDNGWLGFTVENVGDINGDGIEDMGIGDPFYSPVTTVTWLEMGAFYVHYGKNIMMEVPEKYPSNLDGFIYGQVNRSRLGWTAGVIGDTTGGPGSGDELMVSAPFQDEGKVYLFYGATSLQRDLSQPGTFDENFSGEEPGDRFGWSIARSDILGPTTPSISIGAPGYDNRTGALMAESGAVYSFWSWASSNDASTAKAKFYGRAAGDNIGYSMSHVNYTNGATYQQCVLVSSPNAGASNTGDLEVLRRNQLPLLKDLSISPPTGSATTMFDLGITYKDMEGDPPEVITLDVFSDANGLDLKKTISLSRDPADTNTIDVGVKYIGKSTLPNSITKLQPNGPLYVKAFAKAVRGSRDPVSNAIKPVQGPVVDGVLPSAVDNINWIKGTSVPVEERIPGTFKISFEWPEENEGFLDTSVSGTGRVKMLQIRYAIGNATLNNQDWNDYKVYRNFTGGEIENYLTREEVLMGIEDITKNPLGIRFDPRSYVSIAFRAVDEVGNWGNVSYTIPAQVYFRPLDIPDVCLEVDLQDHKGEDGEGDNGGALKLTFIPPNIQHIEDIGLFWVFLEMLPFTSVSDLKANDSNRQPDLIITPADEEGFYNHTVIVTTSKGTTLEDGNTYYATVVTVNKWGQYTDKITLSNGAKVINDKELPIPKIRDVIAEGLKGEKKIKITWTPTTLPRFVQYQVYGQNFFFNDVDQAYLLATITSASVSELVVSEIGGLPINSRNLYSFAVLVLDHNDDIDMELDGNNSIHGVHYIEPDGVPIANPLGFSVNDIPADGGAALSLSWFPELGLGEFWQYRIYFDDKPIGSVKDMQPYTTIGNYKTGDIVIDQFKGAPLIDGMMYYAAVTILDYNLEENYTLGSNNYDWAEPINQSDRTAPQVFPTDLKVVEGSITSKSIELSWSPVQKVQVMDFNSYLIRYSSSGKVGSLLQDQLENGTARIDGLTRGTEYNVNISVVDDNGNIGPSSLFLTVETAGKEQPPVIHNVSIMFNEVVTFIENSGGYFNISSGDIRDEVYLTVYVTDDYTKSKFYYSWNITTPKGESTEKNGADYYQFALELPKDQIGEYDIRVKARDEAGLYSEEFTFKIKVSEVNDKPEVLGPIIIVVFVLILLAAAGVVVFMLVSGKSSQQKQMVEQYEERRKDIETMDTIYTDLPTWTCSCGTTRIQIIENANCPSCFESHEAVPIDQMDSYLRDHDLVIKEMRIEVPSGWQGQDMAKDRSKKDLEDRKKRSLSALNEEFAIYLKGTKYEEEIKPPEPGEGVPEEPGKKTSLYHEGAIIPGQAPPTGPVQQQIGPHPPMMMMPLMPGRPGVPPSATPGQPVPMRPMIPPQPLRPPQQPQK